MADQLKSNPKIHYPKLGVCLFIGLIIWWLPLPNLPDGLIPPNGANFAKGWCVRIWVRDSRDHAGAR